MSGSTVDLRVRYAELAGDHVYYANYFALLEVAMGKFYKDHGAPFLGHERKGVRTMVAESYARFIEPARYDDEVRITSTLAAAAPKRLLFDHIVTCDGRPLLQAATTHVLLNAGERGLQPFSEEVLDLADKRVDRVNAVEASDDETAEIPDGAFYNVAEMPIRYKETDAVGIVYFSNYYIYYEVGRTELFRSAGLTFNDLKAGGLRLPVVKAYCRYLAPARYGDTIAVKTWVAGVKKVRLTFGYELSRRSDGSPIAVGFTTHACLNDTGRAERVPEPIAGLAHTV